MNELVSICHTLLFGTSVILDYVRDASLRMFLVWKEQDKFVR